MGVGLAGNVLAPVASEWPEISPAQRLEITSLMQAAMDTEVAYAQARNQAVLTRYALQVKPPLVFQSALLPEAPVRPRKTPNTALGTASGLMLGVFWVFAAA